MKILQINTTINTGSTGRIAEEIGQLLISNGHQSYISYGRGNRPSKSNLIKIGNNKDVLLHVLKTRITDKHGFGSKRATKKLVKIIKEIKPDLIHLHNLHGYYLNIEVLFNFLKEYEKPVVWTLHDCWAFTGHCAHFERVDCYNWQTHCENCPLTKYYPASYLLDNSKKNFYDKKRLFTSLKNMHIVTPSEWLAKQVKSSFLADYPISVLNNGIDLNVFKPIGTQSKKIRELRIGKKKIVLGVSNIWTDRKGLNDFIKLSALLGEKYKIVLVGLKKRQIAKLPSSIIGITRTENVNELVELYSAADVFVNPTYTDTFPTTNIEALACGTPVITYNTGGSPEAIDNETGIVVPKGEINGLYAAVQEIFTKEKTQYKLECRKRAESHFDKNERFGEYIKLYQTILIDQVTR